MDEPKITAPMFSLNLPDVWKGLLVAVAAAVLSAAQQALFSNTFSWSSLLTVAGIAAVAYLIKNFFTPPVIIIPATPEQVKTFEKTGLVPTQEQALKSSSKAAKTAKE